MSKFNVGDRVRAVAASAGWGGVKKGDVGTIKEVLPSDSMRDYAVDFESHRNWKAEVQDLELVTSNEEGQQPVGRKTYKQLQESVTVKKGALWQEACDDGDQEYILLDQSFNKDSRNTQRIYDRSLVEEDSKHFVEVFKVEPQYMTREELDKWEAFKGRKKPGPKAKVIGVDMAKVSADKTTIMEWTVKTGRTWTPAQRRAQSRKIKAAWAAKKASK